MSFRCPDIRIVNGYVDCGRIRKRIAFENEYSTEEGEDEDFARPFLLNLAESSASYRNLQIQEVTNEAVIASIQLRRRER